MVEGRVGGAFDCSPRMTTWATKKKRTGGEGSGLQIAQDKTIGVEKTGGAGGGGGDKPVCASSVDCMISGRGGGAAADGRDILRGEEEGRSIAQVTSNRRRGGASERRPCSRPVDPMVGGGSRWALGGIPR